MINSAFLLLVVLVFTIFALALNMDKLLISLFSKKDEIKYKKICPRCGSTKVAVDFSNPVVWAYGTTTKYKCKECGYLGNTFPEISEDNIQNYKKELKYKGAEMPNKVKSELIDATAGYPVGIFEIILAFVGFILIPFILLIDGFNPLLFILFWTLISAYLVWRIYKRKKSSIN